MGKMTFTSWMTKTASACLMVLATLVFGSNLTAQSTNCGCYNVTVTLDANCQFTLTRNLVSDGSCAGAYV
ncbi:hypothetical protein, partial [Haliscomenobacter sp.]|uniref:hypothetical protein n=1 Tax=Haliscomenobacter sp. TaxID=2717303 RepID=UPI0035934E75